jgi:hypothetical protein
LKFGYDSRCRALHYHMFQRFLPQHLPSSILYLLLTALQPRLRTYGKDEGKVKPGWSPTGKLLAPANQVGMARHVKRSQNRIALKILNNYAYPRIYNCPRCSYDFSYFPPLTSFLSLKLHLMFHCMSLPSSFSTAICIEQRRPRCHQLYSQRSLF